MLTSSFAFCLVERPSCSFPTQDLKSIFSKTFKVFLEIYVSPTFLESSLGGLQFSFTPLQVSYVALSCVSTCDFVTFRLLCWRLLQTCDNTLHLGNNSIFFFLLIYLQFVIPSSGCVRVSHLNVSALRCHNIVKYMRNQFYHLANLHSFLAHPWHFVIRIIMPIL